MRGHLTFTFQGCNDLTMALCKTLEVYDKDCYEIGIGGWNNTKSVIRDGHHVSLSALCCEIGMHYVMVKCVIIVCNKIVMEL